MVNKSSVFKPLKFYCMIHQLYFVSTFLCSIYEASIQCLLSTSPYTYTTAGGQSTLCRPVDVAPVVKDGSRMYYDIMRASGIIPAIAINMFKKIDYTECDGMFTAGYCNTVKILKFGTPQSP